MQNSDGGLCSKSVFMCTYMTKHLEVTINMAVGLERLSRHYVFNE